MDERRAIFEHFVEHRREDLKAEKKSKLKQAKQLFAQLLHDRFQDKSWDCNTTLSVFLSTLEDHVDPARYKQVQDEALVFLPMSVQEKIYTKAVPEFKVEALKRDGEELRLTKFLEERLASLDQSKLDEESDEVQRLVNEFYCVGGKETALLSVAKQQQVLKDLVARMARGRDVERQEQNERVLNQKAGK
ncbi:hypothetical protein BBJ28_00012056 [Nothophytophthora sp. Chile5]|nr:hypothetical protein BBJ28_00012056 [Nothophytophthora sp. Chile5]